MNRKPIFILAALALCSSVSFAQAPSTTAPAATPPAAPVQRRPPAGPDMRGGMPQGRQDMRGRMQDQRGGSSNYHRSNMSHDRGGFQGGQGGHGSFSGGMGAAFHIVPPGMWWKSPAVVQKLTLTADQTKKMDDIFQQSRIQLIDLKANVEKQNVMLEPMLSANPPDTNKTLAQIDKVAQARADLEKANAKMLLGIRGVLTPDQWTKLRAGGPGGFGGRGGAADAPAAPGAGGQPGGPGGGGRGRGPGGPGGGRGGDFAPEPQQ